MANETVQDNTKVEQPTIGTGEMQKPNVDPMSHLNTMLSKDYIKELMITHPWVNRAVSNPNDRTTDNKTVHTAVEFVPDLGWIVFPTVRMGENGLEELDLRSAQEKAIMLKDYISVPSVDAGNELSFGLSNYIQRESTLPVIENPEKEVVPSPRIDPEINRGASGNLLNEGDEPVLNFMKGLGKDSVIRTETPLERAVEEEPDNFIDNINAIIQTNAGMGAIE